MVAELLAPGSDAFRSHKQQQLRELRLMNDALCEGGFSRKLYIPVKKYPQYNFLGLIIGPRGNNIRRMRSETKCRIQIRGRGSPRELDHPKSQHDDLHVLISGTDEIAVEKARFLRRVSGG